MCSQNGRGSICKQGDWPCRVCGKMSSLMQLSVTNVTYGFIKDAAS